MVDAELAKWNHDIDVLLDECKRLRAEIEELKAEASVGVVEDGVSEWRRQECLRLAALNAELMNALKMAEPIVRQWGQRSAIEIIAAALAKARSLG